MSMFVNGLLHQTRLYDVPTELIMVEWNPPADKPLLHEVLPKPAANDRLEIRYIVVPNEIHKRYKRSGENALYQMIAKNVGIRRAKGEYVLCTNVDLLFSHELFRFLQKKQLRPDSYYRCLRCDVTEGVKPEWNFDEQLAFCSDNILKKLGKTKDAKNIKSLPFWVYKYPRAIKTINYFSGAVRSRLDPLEQVLVTLDTSACGDFTLMHKNAWLDIQGYPELDLYSIHIDSMALFAAAGLGYKQELLEPEECSYHIHHEEGWEAFNPLELVKFCERRPGLDWSSVYLAGRHVIENKCRYNINAPNWGFSDMEFEEIVCSAATEAHDVKS